VPVTPSLVRRGGGLGVGSSMSVPVEVQRGSVPKGFIIVQRRPTAVDFSAGDLEALAALARGVAAILPGVLERNEQSGTTWAKRDMDSAREMQRMFLPRPLDQNSAGVRVLAEYLPAFAVGGDFYDFVDLGGGRLMAAIGDVSGKGVTAALMMSRITSELRRLAHGPSGAMSEACPIGSSLAVQPG